VKNFFEKQITRKTFDEKVSKKLEETSYIDIF
jgi:hypothetical protein